MDIVKVLPEDLANKFRSKHDLYQLLRYDCKTYFSNCKHISFEFCLHTFKVALKFNNLF